MSDQCVHIAIIWHLSLTALTDCTQKCDLGSGHFNLTEMTRPQVLKMTGLLISFHRLWWDNSSFDNRDLCLQSRGACVHTGRR